MISPARPSVAARRWRTFVAISGRIVSGRALRYKDLPLPQPPGRSVAVPHTGARRRSIGRRSGIAYLFMFITSGGTAAAAWLNWDSQARAVSLTELVLSVDLGIACLLAGPAARFVVTPEHLHILVALHRISVPRTLLGGFATRGLEVRIDLIGGGLRYFRVDSPLWDLAGGDYRMNGRTQFRTVTRIVAMCGPAL